MRVGLAVGGVVLIGVGVAIGFGGFWPKSAHAEEQVTDHIGTVEIANDSGSVQLRAADVRQASVHEEFHYQSWGGEPDDHSYSVRGGTLVLSGCGNWCDVDYTVVVPRGEVVTGHADSGDVTIDGARSVDVRVSSGSVTARHVAGDAKVHASSGTVALFDVGGDVTAEANSGDVRLARIAGTSTVHSDSGSVTATGLGGKTEVRADSGDVRLTMAETAGVSVRADSGDVAVTVPRAKYHVEGSTDSGSRTVSVPRDSSSPYVLDLTADSGDVTVRTP